MRKLCSFKPFKIIVKPVLFEIISKRGDPYFFPVERDGVARAQLLAAHGAGLAVHEHLALGDPDFGLTARADQVGELEQSVELDKLALNDCYADASYMKEYLSYEMFRSLGVATPLCAFANITVNGEPRGLYLAVECIEERFALRNYGAENINLYKPETDDMGRGGNLGGGKGA